jgi:serine/threonine protein phosphatase PrpC
MGGCCTSKDHKKSPEYVLDGLYPSNYNPVFPTQLVGAYSTHGIRGKDAKQNQDTGLAVINFAGNEDQLFFMVCDGHGSTGHKVSQIASKSIITTLEKDKRMKDMLSDKDHTKGGVVQALTEACVQAQRELEATIGREAHYSGTTCVATAIHLNHMWTACVGDSRAVVGAIKGDKVLALDLSIDQCCSNPTERARIASYKGSEIAEFGGFERVMAPNKTTVLAPTRSIGDMEFDIVGVIPDPEVTHFQLSGQEQVLIIASDGLWEFISSSQAVSIAMQCEDATEATDKLLQLSKSKWAKDGLGNYCDDITILVIFLPLLSGQLGSHQTASAAMAADMPPDELEMLDKSDSGEFAPETCQLDTGTLPPVKDQQDESPSWRLCGCDADAYGSKDADTSALKSTGTENLRASQNAAGPTESPTQLGRRRSKTELEAADSVKTDKKKLGQDTSIVDVKQRNIDNFDGLNPNARGAPSHHSWSPEWDRTMWPSS